MRIGIASPDVSLVEFECGSDEFIGNRQALGQRPEQPGHRVAPGFRPESLERSLDRFLGCLLGCEDCPVEETASESVTG